MVKIIELLGEQVREPICLCNKANELLYANAAFETMFGLKEKIEEIIEQSLLEDAKEQMKRKGSARLSFSHPQFDEPLEIVGLTFDDTIFMMFSPASKRASMLVHYKDPLTGVFNREALLHYLRFKCMTAYEEENFALLFVDLDKFKKVNDGFGHKAGDILLKEVVKRLKSMLRKNDYIGRYGGDEFLIVLDGVEEREVKKIAAKIVERLEEPSEIEGKKIDFLSASIGIAFCTKDAKNPLDLIEKADKAMYGAKKSQKTHILLYDELEEELKENLTTRFLQALRDEEIFVKFQPIYDKNREIVAAEALVRWIDLKFNKIEAQKIIKLANGLGVLQRLDSYVLERAMQDALPFIEQLSFLHVNVSGAFIGHPSFCERVERLLEAYPVYRGRLVLELVEDIYVQKSYEIQKKMEFLRKKGVLFAIDDFGSGYSSFVTLKNLSIDIFKIDKSFVQTLKRSKDLEMLGFLVRLGRLFEATIIVEGVENEEIFESIKDLDIDLFQGFYFDRPLFASTLKKRLQG